jgi:hypothetical protein
MLGALGLPENGLDSALASTVGVLWRAASGTVDPWTANILVEDEKQGLVQASGGKISENDAGVQAASDVNNSLLRDAAHPSQFWEGVKRSLSQGESSTLLILGGLALLLVGATILPLLVPRR